MEVTRITRTLDMVMQLRIVHISDTHGHAIRGVPYGDILIHSGDGTNRGTLSETARLNSWLGDLPHPYKLYIPGNHDFLFQLDPVLGRSTLGSCTVLIEEEIEIEGIRIYGTPYQPRFNNWAFNCFPEELTSKYACIPTGLDVLVTHCPPYGILDRCPAGRVGSRELRSRLLELGDDGPKYHLFGHVHESYGMGTRGPTTRYSNASICTGDYQPINTPLTWEIDNGY